MYYIQWGRSLFSPSSASYLLPKFGVVLVGGLEGDASHLRLSRHGFQESVRRGPFSAQLDRVPSHFIHEKTAGETGQERPKKQRHKEPTKPKEDTKIMSSTCAMIDVSQDDDPADGAEAGFLPS